MAEDDVLTVAKLQQLEDHAPALVGALHIRFGLSPVQLRAAAEQRRIIMQGLDQHLCEVFRATVTVH